MNAKALTAICAALLAAILLYAFVASRNKESPPTTVEPSRHSPEGLADSAALSGSGDPSSRRNLEPPGIADPHPVDSTPLATQPAPLGSTNLLWTKIDVVSSGLFNGQATSAQMLDLADNLLSHLDVQSGVRRADGTISYSLGGDSSLGTAMLIVDPSHSGRIDQYELRVDAKEASGYPGNHSDITGERLQMWFGDTGNGDWGFRAHVEANLNTMDEAVWSSNSTRDAFPIGGVLSSRGQDTYWTQDTAQAITLTDGKHGWRIGYGNSTPRIAEQGTFSSGLLAGIQSHLSAAGGH